MSVHRLGRGHSVARAPVTEHLLTDTGVVHLGVVATLVDILGGGLALPAVHPDWIATADLAAHLAAPVRAGELVAEGRVLRAGRTTVVIEVDIRNAMGGSERQVGLGMLTFARLPRRADTLELDLPDSDEPGEPTFFALPESGLTEGILDTIGIEITDATSGRLEVDHGEFVINSFSAMQGGVVALLAEVAAEARARADGVADGVTTDLVVHYLTQGIHGPFHTQAVPVGTPSPTGATLRIETHDGGDPEHPGGRLMTVAVATVRPLA